MADQVPFAVGVRFEHVGPGHQDPAAGPWDRSLVIVAVSGEVDLVTVPELRDTLRRVISPPSREVVVDLAEVEFIDASGVGALVGAAAEAARMGVRFRLQAPSPPVERVPQPGPAGRLTGPRAVRPTGGARISPRQRLPVLLRFRPGEVELRPDQLAVDGLRAGAPRLADGAHQHEASTAESARGWLSGDR